jgi:hypothetical protein
MFHLLIILTNTTKKEPAKSIHGELIKWKTPEWKSAK